MSATAQRRDREQSGLPEESVAIIHYPSRPSIGLLLERWLPLALASCAFVAVWNFPPLWFFRADWQKDLLTNVTAATAILAAYLLTAATILPALEEKVIIQRLRAWKYYDQ